MPASVTIDQALFLSGPTYSASSFRNSDAAALAWNGGSYAGLYQQPNRMKVSASSGMNVTVDTGVAVIPSAAGSTDGAYRVRNSATRTLTATTSDPTNPRIDLVVVGVQDNGDNTSTTFTQIIAGTPAPSPAPPSTPSNAVALAQVRVNAGVSSITSGNITDERVYTVAPGGILPLTSTGAAPAGVDGQYAYDAANDRVFHMATSGPRQARVLPWAPVQAAATANIANSGSETTVLSVSVTTDGSTDIEIMAKWRGILVASAGGLDMFVFMRLYIGSTQVDDSVAYNSANDGVTRGGGMLIHRTGSATGDTPSAGTHTIAWKFLQTYSGSSNVSISGAATSPITLNVRPVIL